MVMPTVPPEAAQRCADPVMLPDRRLSEEESTNLWNRDRTSLKACETRRAAAVGAIEGAP